MKDVHFDVTHGVHDVVKQLNWENTASAIDTKKVFQNLLERIMNPQNI